MSVLEAMFYIRGSVSGAGGKSKTGLILMWAGVGDVQHFKIVGCVTKQEGGSGLEADWPVQGIEGKD